MRRHRKSGNFLLCLLINMVLNLEWSIPAWILLGLHFAFGLSLWWFCGAIALWILRILVGMWLIRWASNVPKDPPLENKNPYSHKNTDHTHI